MSQHLELELDDDDDSCDASLYFIKSKVPTYKVILLGETGSGKTSLFLRYKYGSFRKASTLDCADRCVKQFVTDDGNKVQMVLWDTAGMERMGSLTFHYYHRAHAVLLVFAMNDRTTFDSLSAWNDDAGRYSPIEVKRFLVATKNDIAKDEVDVPTEKINSFCKNMSIADSYYTSAKTGEGIEDMFRNVIRTLRESVDFPDSEEDVCRLQLHPKQKRKRKCAC